MTYSIPRLAASVLAALVATAVLSVSTAQAEEYPMDYDGGTISTTCGAGTKTKCAEKPIESCDWDFQVGFSKDYTFTFKLAKTNCHTIGYVPIYKDMEEKSSLSLSCNALSPILGMPSGSGCSE